jgi:hypothetical protein
VDKESSSFNYVIVKINQMLDEDSGSKKLIVQIIDMSDKILYN